MVRHTIALRYIEECIINCEKNQVKPNTVYMSYKQRDEILKNYKDIEIGSKNQYKVFGLDIITTTEDSFSVGYCATALNNWLKN